MFVNLPSGLVNFIRNMRSAIRKTREKRPIQQNSTLRHAKVRKLKDYP